MADDFPNDVRQFIQRNVESLAQMELLILLRAEREKTFDAADITKQMFFEPKMSAQLLADLVARGFATRDDESFRYQVTDFETDELVGKLADTYRARRVAVTSEIYSKPLNRLRTFADAFRLRKDQ